MDKGLHTLWDNVKAYCFAAAAILPRGFIPLFAISSPRFMIGIPSIYSITKTLLSRQQDDEILNTWSLTHINGCTHTYIMKKHKSINTLKKVHAYVYLSFVNWQLTHQNNFILWCMVDRWPMSDWISRSNRHTSETSAPNFQKSLIPSHSVE